MAGDEAYAPSDEVEYTSFNSEESSLLVENYGEHGQRMLDLNQQYLSGAITEAQMRRAVISDPVFAMSVMDAKSKGLITY